MLSIMSNDIRVKAFVLRRTNFGEADRIINFLTEQGLISAIAKGVRKEKSKLAGAVELFCLSEITLHSGLNNKLCVLTSAKMLEAYSNIVYDLEKLELASLVMKKIGSRASSAPTNIGPLMAGIQKLNAKKPRSKRVFYYLCPHETDCYLRELLPAG